MLIEANADLKVLDMEGATALSLASQRAGNAKEVRMIESALKAQQL